MKMFNAGKRNFYIRILLPTILTIILFITAFFALFIPQFENTIMDRKRETIKELTNSAWSILDKWHKNETDGLVTKEKAQEMAISQIQSLRYGEESKDYFWITDYKPTMIMHPYRPELNKKDLSNFKDSQGKKLFVEMAQRATASGDGFVYYTWQWKDDSTKIVSKLSYVKSFEAWQWIIGTGIYIEDVKNEIAQLEKKIINVSIGITLAIAVLLFFIAYQNLRTEKLRMRAEEDLHHSREKYRTLVEASTEGLIMIIEGGQIFYNKTLYNILGYKEETGSLTLAELFVKPPKLKSIDLNTLTISASGNSTLDQAETVLKKVDGSLLNVLISVSPIKFLNNSGVVLSVKDISVSKKIEAELDLSKEKYLALTNQLSIGVFSALALKQGLFTESNSATIKLLGVENKEILLETSLADYFEDSSEFDLFYSDLIKNNSVQNRFITLRKSNGSISAVSISALLVKSESGIPISIDGIIEDISVQDKSNKERDNLIHELQSAFLFLNNSVENIIKPIPSCSLSTQVNQALKLLNAESSNCLLVEDMENNAIGFISDYDIMTRVLADKDYLTKPVFEYMSSPLITILRNATIFDAVEMFNKYGVEHLLCRNYEGKIIGVINSSHLQSSFHSSYLFFINKIQDASAISEICRYHSQLMFLVKGLIELQPSFNVITKLITSLSDTIFKRVLELAIEKLGTPPAKFSFIILGSSGRGEQTLATDQDNAIIYQAVSDKDETEVNQYFLKLGNIVAASLNQIGYDYCKGEIMASNPKWCQPINVWKDYFTNWVTTSNPQDLLDIKIFFDFRSVYGEDYLVNELHEHVTTLTAGYNSFFVYLSESIIQFQMPEGALKLKSPFDIKMVMLPLVDLARLYALKKKCSFTNTIERLDYSYENGVFSKQAYKNILQVYNFLMQKRFEHQSSMMATNLKPDNKINPNEFSDLDIVLFKKSLLVIEELQNKLKLDFKGSITI